MADIWMDVDAALSEVPVNVLPLLDDTDFKSVEDSVAYNASGMDLVWNFVTSAGVFTQTAVTPTTSGTYDWTSQGNGMYTIEIPASGGASINNDTEGYGWFTGVATGVLPWRGPIIGFRAAAINDSLCDTNATGLLAPTTAGRTLDVASTGEAGIDFGNVLLPVGAIPALGWIDNGDSQGGGTASNFIARAGLSLADDVAQGVTIGIYAGTGIGQSRLASANVGSSDTFTVSPDWEVTPDNTSKYWIAQTAPSSGGSGLDAAGVRAAIGLASANLDTQLADIPTVAEMNARTLASASYATASGVSAVETDTQDIQSRLPAALVGGRIDATVDGTGMEAGAVAAIADGVWEEALADHEGTVGSTAEALADAGGAGASAADIADAVLDEALSGHTTAGTLGERIGRIPNAAAGGNGGLPTVDANNRVAGMQGTITTLDALDTAQDSQHATTQAAIAGLNDLDATEVQTAAAAALTAYDPPTNAEMEARTLAAASYATAANQTPGAQYKKNVAASNIPFVLVDSTDHVTRETGITPTATRSIDGAAFEAVTGTITEIGNGAYVFDASQADMNGDNIVFRFTGEACDPVELHIKTYT